MKKTNNLFVRIFGSFGLCTALLVGLFILTFLGTIQSAEEGLFSAQEKYFNSYGVIHHVGPLAIPLPGALTLMILLAINLFVGGFVRMRKSKRTLGVLIVHGGIAFLLLAGLVKMMGGIEGHVTLYEGQKASDFVSYDFWEVAVIDVQGDSSNNEWAAGDKVVRSLEGDDVRVLSGEGLPFDVHLQYFVPNASVMPKGPRWNSRFPVVDGFAIQEHKLNPESGGNFATVFATVVPKDSSVGTEGSTGILWGRTSVPFVVEWDGRPFSLQLRRERYPLPFEVQLETFTKKEHPRTRIASVFSSDVLRIEGDDRRPVHISMNEPLRENGLVMFQSSWGPADAPPGTPLFSTFAVVRNPSDKWPEYSCWVIALGMLITFGQRLRGYLNKQSKMRDAARGEVA
ncbi:MAG: cytochrome c biogenesis protein ResB [Planctomycetota bacterium]|nr:cytochrome c biogenesis protein ResB [Planctomycetota bacterium]